MAKVPSAKIALCISHPVDSPAFSFSTLFKVETFVSLARKATSRVQELDNNVSLARCSATVVYFWHGLVEKNYKQKLLRRSWNQMLQEDISHCINTKRKLRLESVLEENGEKYVALYLTHDDAASKNSVINAIYKLFIYDQLHVEHVQKEGEAYFHSTYRDGFCCKIVLDKFNSPTSGLLVNDCCIFGAEVLKAFECKLDKEGISESLSLKKDITPRIYTWVIKDVSKSKVRLNSESFDAGGYSWSISLYPNLDTDKDFLSIYLRMDKAANLASKTRVYVDSSICLLDQHNDKHSKRTAKNFFSSESSGWGWNHFLSWKEVQDPSRGFLRNGTCIVEASVVVLGVYTIA